MYKLLDKDGIWSTIERLEEGINYNLNLIHSFAEDINLYYTYKFNGKYRLNFSTAVGATSDKFTLVELEEGSDGDDYIDVIKSATDGMFNHLDIIGKTCKCRIQINVLGTEIDINYKENQC